MATQLPFNGFYQGESRKQSGRTCVNFMPVPGDSGDQSQYALFTTTGIDRGVSLQSDVDEAAYWRSTVNDRNTVCASTRSGFDTNIFSIPVELTNGTEKTTTGASYTANPTENFWRSVIISIQPVADFFAMVASFDAVTTGDSYGTVVWTWDGSAWSSGTRIFESIGVAQYQQINITDVAYLNGIFLYLNPVVRYDGQQISELSNRIYYSGVLDPESVDELAFISSVSQVGNLVGMEAINSRLYVFSETEMSVFAPNPNTTDTDIPFIEQQNSARQVGLAGNRAKTVFGDSIYMIGSVEGQRRFVRVQSGSPQVISTKEINYILERAQLEDPRVFEFQDQGRSMIAFSFDDYTLCLDVQTGEYHRRSTNGGRWECVFQSPDGVFVSNDAPSEGVVRGPRAGKANARIGTEFGEIMQRECITSNFNSNGVTNRLSEITMITEVDYQNYTAEYSNPNLGLSVSGDSGNTFGLERSDNFGGLGDYDKRMRFTSLGVYRDSFTIRMRTSNPYPHRLNKMLAKLKKGRRQV